MLPLFNNQIVAYINYSPLKEKGKWTAGSCQGWYQTKICLAMLSTIIKGIQRCQPELNWLTFQKLIPHIRSMNIHSEHSMTGPRGVLTLRLWARERCDVAWIMSSFLWSWLTYLIRIEALRMTTLHYGIDRLVTYCYSCTIPQWVQWHWANFHLCMAISANHHG